jgi:DNA primase
MKDITRFINEELKPRLYGSLPQILPQLQFTRSPKGDKWISPLHYDGSEGTGERADRCIVTEKYPTRVWDNSRQEAKDIIALFMEFNRLEVWEAVKRLCSIVGIAEPQQGELTPEQKERFAVFEEKRKLLEESVRRQALALYKPKDSRAAEVADYIYKRGFKDWDLCETLMGGRPILGYINEEEVSKLAESGIYFADTRIGKTHTLSIPVYSGSILCGIKFRTIKNADKKDRYTSYSLYGKEKVLYNLTGIKQANGTIVVVEGELDALIAEYNGLRGFVATGGGGLTDELLATARNRGAKRITLLLDADAMGAEFVRESIKTAHKSGISILVATIPQGESLPDGTPIHDVGEYLQAHTIDELQSLIDRATSGSMWLLTDLITSFEKDNDEITDANEIDLRNEVIALANHTPNEAERDRVLTAYANAFCIDGKQAFSAEALRAVADRERVAQDAIRKAEETRKALQEATALAEKGGTQAALKRMEEAIYKAKQIGNREQYGDLLRIPTEDDFITMMRDNPEALVTSYQFIYGGGSPIPLTIASGALTEIAAPTGHGKSTFLRNLAIDIAKRYYNEDGAILYFTFEETYEDVRVQFINTYIGELLHAVSGEHDQKETIANYYRSGKKDTTYIGGRNATIQAEEFVKRADFFTSKYLNSGKLRIYYKDYALEELIEALEFAVRNIKTRAIFIDYIQILRSQKLSSKPRSEQLKDACTSLMHFSTNHKLPVIMATQMTRDATTPLQFNRKQMSESSDIEKSGHTIICTYLSNDKAPEVDKANLKKDIKVLEELGFKFGTDGKMFAMILKRRGRGVGMYSIFDFKGYAGKVVENYTPEAERPEQGGTVKTKISIF